jgi:hypothetical protein
VTQTIAENGPTLAPAQQQKQQRKQEKRQAKMLLQVKQARRDVQKAQMKMANAQLEHEIATIRQRAYEEQLNQLRSEGAEQEE